MKKEVKEEPREEAVPRAEWNPPTAEELAAEAAVAPSGPHLSTGFFGKVMEEVDSGDRPPAAGAFTEFAAFDRLPATAAPRLGADTDAVLAQHLGLDATTLADLRADGVIAGTDDN